MVLPAAQRLRFAAAAILQANPFAMGLTRPQDFKTSRKPEIFRRSRLSPNPHFLRDFDHGHR
jgi:hypothetical protein